MLHQRGIHVHLCGDAPQTVNMTSKWQQLLGAVCTALLLLGCSSPTGTHQGQSDPVSPIEGTRPDRVPSSTFTPTRQSTSPTSPSELTQPTTTPSPAPTEVPIDFLSGKKDTPTPDYTITPSPTPTPTPSYTPWPTNQYLHGPLVAYLAYDYEFGKFYLLLLDVGSRQLRRLDVPWNDGFVNILWFQDGCQLFLDGKFYDLRGNLIRALPEFDPNRYHDNELFHTLANQLSPDGNWLAEELWYGGMLPYGPEFTDYGTVSLTDPNRTTRLTWHGTGGPIDWSLDSQWIAFSDLDEAGIPQVFRANPDGANRQQLTEYSKATQRITSLAWSPDSAMLAVGVDNRVNYEAPYAYDEIEEGWIDILEVNTFTASRILDHELWNAGMITWNNDATELAVMADDLPVQGSNGDRMYWVNVDKAEIVHTLYFDDLPNSYRFRPWVPVGDLDHILIEGNSGTEVYHRLAGEFEQLGDLLADMEIEPHAFTFSVAPQTFPGEANCQYHHP